MSKRPLVPSFLQKADDKLLRNNPDTWATRVHLVLYFAVSFALLLFVFCYAVFFDAKQYSSIGSWNVFVGLVVFIGFVFWLIYLLRFNVFKRYGNWSVLNGLRDFGLYFICIGAMVAVCFVPSAVETMRANQQFADDEIVKDINELNVNACKLEYSLLPLKWRVDSCKIIERKDAVYVPNDTEQTTVTDTVVVVTPSAVVVAEEDDSVGYVYTYLDTAELRRKLLTTDSLLKINDSFYVFYECPDYRFISSYQADEYTAIKQLTSADIYNRFLKNYTSPDRNKLLKRMEELKTKYAISPYYGYGEYYDNNDQNISYDAKISRKYDLLRISNGIDNVVRKKYAWKDDWPIYIRVFYYLTLIMTMLVFIYRHSTTKTFFLSLLTAVLLAIATGLLLVISQGDESSFIILYSPCSACRSLKVICEKRYRGSG